MKTAFITTFCAHYRVGTFETLARHHAVDYYFFSEGKDWYWQQENGIRRGNFHFEYLAGFEIGRTRVTPALPLKLWRGRYDVYVKCINGRFVLPLVYLIARLRGRPFILWTGIWMRIRTPVHRLFYGLTRYTYRHSDAIVVYGEHVRRFLEGEGVPADRIFLAPQAVDNAACSRPISATEREALRGRLGLDAGQEIILYVGRLEEAKGVLYLVEAFSRVRHPRAALLLVGTGALAGALRQDVSRLGLKARVLFAGHVQPEETPAWYAIASVCVVPSVTTRVFKEPWGLAVNEAFNQGIPVIGTTSVGAAAGGLLQNGVNGLIVEERDVAALAGAIEVVLGNPGIRTMMGRNARAMILKWDNERMVRGFRQAIDFVMSKH